MSQNTATLMQEHLLAINAAEGAIQLALATIQPCERGQPLALAPVFLQRWQVSGQGAEILVSALQSACALMHVAPASIKRIAAVCGPGGFTGIRLALGSASGLARATGALQAGLDYMHLLALNTAHKRGLFQGVVTAHLTVLTHARRNLVHARHFTLPDTNAPETLIAASPLQVLTLDEVPAFVKNGPDPAARILGSGLSRNRPALLALLEKVVPPTSFMPPAFDMPDETTLLKAAGLATYQCNDIAPNYARQSEAEDNFEGIAKKLNLDAEKARAALSRYQG